MRGMGLKIGYVSNTLDPPHILLEVMEDEHMLTRADAIVLSSELGYRKPSPLIYQAATQALELDPARTLFVGDRVLEDVVGPKRAGMTAVLAEWFRDRRGRSHPGRPPCQAPAGAARNRRRRPSQRP